MKKLLIEKGDIARYEVDAIVNAAYSSLYRFPKHQAAQIAMRAIRKFFESDSSIEQVILVCFDEEYFINLNNINY